MEDLSSQINNLLNSKEGMQQIQAVASALGLGNAPAPPSPTPAAAPPPEQGPASGIDTNQIMGMLSQLGLGQPSQSSAPSAPPIDLNMMMQIQKAMSAFASGSKNVDLLRSLRPHLSPARQKKVDDAVKIMQLIQMLPLLKESGLFGSGGGNG